MARIISSNCPTGSTPHEFSTPRRRRNGLGATCYALLTGRPPFEGSTLVERITRIRQDEPVKPSKFQMGIPSTFEGAILKMLAKRPEDRFQTAESW